MSYQYLLTLCLILASTKVLSIATGRLQLPQVVGSLLAGLPMKQMLGGARVWVLSAVRLLVMPAALWLVLRNLAMDPLVMGIAVTQMAMPTAINGTILCMAYGGDSEAMAQITFMTTLASIVTIPLVAAMLL